MKCSIAMATYNGARFVEQQLQSFAAQTLPPFELVVCDDGSTDDTLRIVEAFASRASFPVRVEQNRQNLGVSGNFLKAATLCRGDWIAFSDQDDVWLPNKLERIASVSVRNPRVVYAAHRATLVDESLRPLGGELHVPRVHRTTINPRLSLGFWLYPYGCTLAFDARLIRDFPPAARPIESHDKWVYLLANVLGETAFMPEALSLYRRHGSNYSNLDAPPPLFGAHTREGLASEFKAASEQVARFASYLRERGAAGGRDGVALTEAGEIYGKLAENLARRSLLYARAPPWIRAARYVELFLRGGYLDQRRGGLGWRALAKDAPGLVLR